MCGITCAFSTKANKKGKIENKVNQIIINQFQDQCTRGQRGFGIIRINKGKVEIDRACETTKFLLDLYLKPSQMIIAHHRTPTSTENLMDQTHPMFVSNDLLENDYLIVHNGVISNDDELRLKHIELGFKYTTEYTEVSYNQKEEQVWNDSEAIAIELALFIEKKISAIGIDNQAAFIILQINKKTNKAKEVFFGKNGIGSDLNVYKEEGILEISSEGRGSKAIPNVLFSFDIKDPMMTLKETPIPFIKKEIPKAITPTDNKTSQILSLPVKTNDKTPNINTRSWKDTYVSYTQDDNYLPPYAGKNYVDEQKAAFKERIKTEDAEGVATETENALDEEEEKLSELIKDYKETLMMEKLSKTDMMYYSSQIFRITRTMQEITDIGEDDHKEKLALEKEEMEQDIDDYNFGFGIKNTKKDEEARREEIEKHLEESRCGYLRE